jgi:branched-chain amino acid aminotransferase
LQGRGGLTFNSAIEKVTASRVWVNGEMKKWDEATVHISSSIVNYGAGIFEGIKAYQGSKENYFWVFRLEEHIERFYESAKVHRMDLPFTRERLKEAVISVVSDNRFSEDVYIRPIAYRGGFFELLWGLSPVEVAIFAIPNPREERLARMDKGIRCCTSSWRRIPDSAMPPRAKACSNYMNSRLAKNEARSFGFDDAVLLTINGKVSEGSGANIFLVKNGLLITPSVTSDILEGINRKTILEIGCNDLGLKIIERDIDRTELYLTDELFLSGTVAEVTPITSMDNILVGDGKVGTITKKIKDMYFNIVTGKVDKYKHWLTPAH